jgi:hypothetical protein
VESPSDLAQASDDAFDLRMLVELQNIFVERD